MKILGAFITLFSSSVLICCVSGSGNNHKKENHDVLNKSGTTLETRFLAPKGFKRMATPPHSFTEYLRRLSLKPDGAKVKLFNGQTKENDVYDAVVDMDIGNTDLQQCADAVMRLRGEYLFGQKRYDEISFNFNGGFTCDYAHWMQGYRVKIRNEQAYWERSAEPANNYQVFRKYMDVVFDYAGTLALSKLLNAKPIKDMEIGDVFIKGGSPGHAVIVVDMAEDKAGHKTFMLAQSYMPAQDIQVLKNMTKPDTSPWYNLSDITATLTTPEWIFAADQLKGW